MKGWRFPEVLIGFLLASSLFASGTAFETLSQPNQPKQQAAGNETAEVEPAVSEDKRIADYTEALAALTGILALVAIAQMAFLIRADGTARTAANAANLSARAAVRIELPILRPFRLPVMYRKNQVTGAPEQNDLGEQVPNGLPTSNSYVGSLDIWNAGRTAAIVSGVKIGWAIGPALPAVPAYVLSATIPGGTTVPPGAEFTNLRLPEQVLDLSSKDSAEIASGRWRVWFFVLLSYTDFMEDCHDVGFCWEWHRSTTGWFGPRAANAPEAYTKRA